MALKMKAEELQKRNEALERDMAKLTENIRSERKKATDATRAKDTEIALLEHELKIAKESPSF